MPLTSLELLSPEGPIARRLPGFEARPQQVEMALATERAFERKGRLLVEAATGIGKSFAYLVPAIRRVVERRERIVIATHTISLQEQLIEKDIPLLNAVIPEEFSAVLVKGRGNYVSLRRLKLASERQDRLFGDEHQRHALHELEDWAYETTDGTLSSLPQVPRPDVWDHVQSDSGNCMGRKCPHHEDCFFQRARRRMEHANILVCNHAIFFSDLALRMRSAGFLPDYHHVILDEAHAVEDVASDHFGLSLSESRVQHLLRVLHDPRRHKGFLAAYRARGGATESADAAIRAVIELRAASDDFFDELHAWLVQKGGQAGRMREPDVVANTLSGPMTALATRLRILRDQADRDADQFELNSYATRAMDIAAAAEALVSQSMPGCVYFVETSGGRFGRETRPRMVLRSAVIDVAPVLREHLFGAEQGVVLTSATLATQPGDFTLVKRRLGCEDAETLELDSPFDLRRQVRLFIDPTMPDPGSRDYSDRLAERIERLVAETDGGAFVLFTSYAMLRATAARLRGPLGEQGHPVLVHGEDGPAGLLLKRFRDDRRSVLFGTASFWQGVDVRGEGLRNVIITRLPFEVPDHPLVEARGELIEAEGGNPFRDDSLPRAIVRFRQGIGRLVRSRDDRGIVAVLDPRFVNKSYGRAFQRVFPEGMEWEQAGETL